MPSPTETPAASHRADCDAARSARRSCSSPLPAPGLPRQSLPSPPCSTAAVAVSQSKPPRDGNCAPQLANYLANEPPASIRRGASAHRHHRTPGEDRASLTLGGQLGPPQAPRLRPQFQRKIPRRRKMPDHIARGNATRARVRSGVGHVFAVQKCRLGLVIRTVGIGAHLASLTYNFTRLAWLSGRTAPA
jgi:hypothetical protein